MLLRSGWRLPIGAKEKALPQGEVPAGPFGSGCSRNPVFIAPSQQFGVNLCQQIVGLLFPTIVVVIWMMESAL
jgi:hypothetical protein